jgi:hypothetical protein
LRPFKDIFRELDAFDYKCEAFIKTTRLFEDIFREMGALFINLRPFKTILVPVRPCLLYGSETWVLTKKEENQLLEFKRKVLRTICGPKILNGVYRRRYNHVLDRSLTARMP